MKLYKTWICRKDGAYTVSMVRPKCPLCGGMMYKAPAAFSHLVFPIGGKASSQQKQSKAIPPVTESESMGAPSRIVKSMRRRKKDDR